MQRKQRGNGSSPYAIKDLKAAKKILMLIDGYRRFNFEDFEWAEKEIEDGNMGRKFTSDWKEIRKILFKFAKEAGSQKHLMNLAALQQILMQVGMIISSITMVLSSILTMSVAFHWEWAKTIPSILSYAFIPLVIGLALMIGGPPLIARKITIELERFFARRQDFVNDSNVTLRNAVQKIIFSMIEGLRSGRIEFKKKKDYEFGLFHLDYKGVKIIKKPFFFRRYYVVAPDF
jgi:hypothetical protein